MANKAPVQQFTQNWTKTVNWAKQNNIPYSAYYPVYQLDAQKFISSGNFYSETARIKAIEAAAGLNYSNALPTDNPDWQNIRGNAVKNAQDIFTGLNPLKIFGNAVDTIKSTFEHPSSFLGPIGDLMSGDTGAAGRKVLSNHDIWQWVPGAYDLATVFANDPHLTGSKGAEALAKQPLTALLDVVPFGRVGSEALGRTAIGERAANRINISTPELRKTGIWRVGGRLIKSVPAPSILSKETHPLLETHVDPETGVQTATGVTEQPTIGDRWEMFKQKHNISGQQADIGEDRLKANAEARPVVEKLARPALEAINRLKDDERTALIKMSQTDFRPLETKMADSSIPEKIRTAYAAAWDWGQKLLQLDLQSGRAKMIPLPWNTVDSSGHAILDPNLPVRYEAYYVTTDSYKAVFRSLDKSEAAQSTLDETAKPFDAMLYKMDENDRNMYGVFQVAGQLQEDIYQSIKRSIPNVDGPTVDQLRETLPQGERWDRAVADQTPLIRNLLGLPPALDAATKRLFPELTEKPLTLTMVNSLRDLFAPGGLIEQMRNAYRDQDWVQLNKVSKAAKRKFSSNAFKDIPKDGAATLYKMQHLVTNMQKYAAERQKMAEELNKRAVGMYRGKRMAGGYKKSIAYLSQEAFKAHQTWIKAAIHHPPDIWRNAGMEAVAAKLAQKEKTAQAMESTVHALSKQGWADSELTKIRQDPYTMQEIMTNEAKGSLENAMLPDIDADESHAVTEDMYNNLASLRARGEAPLYVHASSNREIAKEPTYDVFIQGLKTRRPSHSFSKTWGYTPSVYDIGAGLLQATKNIVEQDMLDKFITQELMPRLQHAPDTQKILRNYFQTEIAGTAEHVAGTGFRTEGALTTITEALDKFNLMEFNPTKIFGNDFSHPSLNGDYYINKDLARAFERTINDFQFPAQSFVDRGTKLFRFSILGLSPRYTAHILFGGTYLVALRANPGMLKFMPQAVHFAIHNSFKEDTIARFPGIEELKGENSTNEGIAAANYHYIAQRSAVKHWLIPEWLNRRLLTDNYSNRVAAMADLNLRFTRAITRAQKAVVYLDGAAKADREGSMFYDTLDVPRQPKFEGATVDEYDRPVIHPATGRQMIDKVRSEVPMTKEQAHHEGMQAVASVVGNLRHMTPLERGMLTKVFPFYGWTKHILNYVLSYPFDHPYRAMILSQLAMQNSEDVASGLPLRIQLLTFLGQPDQFGNVTAIDTKSLDPLRDTANYASLTGFFESLNPAITGTIGLVDPQISFAGQNLYPQVTFNTLYGTSTASAGGNVFTSAEQFVPQLTALDTAFNISGQYAYLKKTNGGAFVKKITESLGLPLMPEQLNLRQIAAKQELSRYNQAYAASKAAAQGDPNALAGYGANTAVPDPLNPLYNVTPAYIAAMEQQSEDTTGLPYAATAVAPRSPRL